MAQKNKLSYNVNGMGMDNRGAFLTHFPKLNASTILIMDDSELAKSLALGDPGLIVILRNYGTFQGDGDLVDRIDPLQWLSAQQGFAMNNGQPIPNLYLYTTNEPISATRKGGGGDGTITEIVKWHGTLMREAANRGIHLCVINDGVGSPNPEQWHLYDEVLDLCANNPGLFILGLHEYAGGIITSGFVGGTPEQNGLLKPNNWPLGAKATAMTMWHCGRYKFLINYCKANNKPIPRIVITEAGFDETRDIIGWLNTLKRTPPHTSIRGWRTLAVQWKEWFPQWDAQEAYYQQMRYAVDNIYNHPNVLGLNVFAWNNNFNWAQFDIQQAYEFQQLNAAYSTSSENGNAQVPANVVVVNMELLTGTATINLRDAPNLTANILGNTGKGKVWLYKETAVFKDNFYWCRINTLSNGAPVHPTGSWVAFEDKDGASRLTFADANGVMILPEKPTTLPPAPLPGTTDNSAIIAALIDIRQRINALIVSLE